MQEERSLRQGPLRETLMGLMHLRSPLLLLRLRSGWRRGLGANPVNATLYPLRITQAMLDTLDAEKLDLRYRYVLVR